VLIECFRRSRRNPKVQRPAAAILQVKLKEAVAFHQRGKPDAERLELDRPVGTLSGSLCLADRATDAQRSLR
jgi:hypothetical protein